MQPWSFHISNFFEKMHVKHLQSIIGVSFPGDNGTVWPDIEFGINSWLTLDLGIAEVRNALVLLVMRSME